MTRVLLILLFISCFSCETPQVADVSSILGRWQLESVSFRVDGKEYAADVQKLYEASMNQMVWEIKEGNRINELQGGKTFAQNYDFGQDGKITITGYKLYPRVFHLSSGRETLTAETPEITDPSYDYSHHSWEKNVLLDAAFLLNGKLSQTEISSASSVQQVMSFKKLVGEELD